ncbi:MAG: hypothetical protein GY740_16180 [Gammaproteobacteria bacterium]|nr:hypothetical protein [Gammaproteobacteria bacterium]
MKLAKAFANALYNTTRQKKFKLNYFSNFFRQIFNKTLNTSIYTSTLQQSFLPAHNGSLSSAMMMKCFVWMQLNSGHNAKHATRTRQCHAGQKRAQRMERSMANSQHGLGVQ